MKEDEKIYCIHDEHVIDIRDEMEGHPKSHVIIIDKEGTFEMGDKIYSDDFTHYKVEEDDNWLENV